ncbi:MAG: hypothetical protein ABIN96_06320 [Rubrivivax sp.]
MWLLIVEMLIALALLGFIVWWIAFPSRARRGSDSPSDLDGDGESPPPGGR